MDIRLRIFARQASKTHPWQCHVKTTVRPKDVAGDHKSYVVRRGVRRFGFRTEAERAEFIKDFADYVVLAHEK